jgi:hypothetical protein
VSNTIAIGGQRPDLEDQHHHGQQEHHREDRGERRIGLGGLLGIAAGLDAVAGRQRGDDRLQSLLDLRRHLGRLNALVDVALHRDRWHAVAPPQDRVLRAHLDVAELAHGYDAPVAVGERQIAEP